MKISQKRRNENLKKNRKYERKTEDCIIVAVWPKAKSFDHKILMQAETSFEIVTQVRNLRNSKGISPKESLPLSAKGGVIEISNFIPVIKKLSNLVSLTFVEEKIVNATSFMIGTLEFYVPLEGKVDTVKEKEEIQKEIEYNQGFLNSVLKKLSNEKFVSGAPAQVIELERKKKADAEMKINSLQERLNSLG